MTMVLTFLGVLVACLVAGLALGALGAVVDSWIGDTEDPR